MILPSYSASGLSYKPELLPFGFFNMDIVSNSHISVRKMAVFLLFSLDFIDVIDVQYSVVENF